MLATRDDFLDAAKLLENALLQALEHLRVIEPAKLERTLHALSCRLNRIRPHRSGKTQRGLGLHLESQALAIPSQGFDPFIILKIAEMAGQEGIELISQRAEGSHFNCRSHPMTPIK